MTTPAVVCGTNSVTSEPSTPSRAARTRSVTSSNCVLRSVATVSSRTRSFSRERIRESDELQRRELFGAHVRIAPDVGQGCFRLRAAGEARDDERSRDVVRQVRDELRWRRLEAPEVEAERVGDVELDVRPVSEPLRERVRKRAVELDRVHARDAVGEIGGQDPEPRTDLEHDVLRRELREAADHAEDVLVDEEVLPELLLGEREPHESENAAAAFASSRAASSAGSSPRASASAATVWTTFAGSFGRPRRGWGL